MNETIHIDNSPLLLIVDDNPDNLKVLGNILNNYGYKVAIAQNGLQAVDFAKRRIPDIILLDIMMPEMDGFEVCQRLKKDSATKEIPVIFLTALADLDSKLKGFKIGGEDYITKPFAQEEVLARINMILKRKRAEEAMRESEEKLRTVLSSMDDLVFVLDMDGVYEEYYQQDKSDKLYVTSEKFVGKSFKEVMPEEMATKLEKAIEKTKKTGSIEQIEYPLQIGGNEIWFSTKVTTRKDRAGNPTGFTYVARNITERKLAEQALRDSDRMKTEFVSNVSHELRTPLASIVGFSSTILRNKGLDEETRQQFIKIIYDESQRLARLIENVLSISRIESGKASYHLEPLELEPIVQEIFDSQRIQAEEKEITFSCDVENNLPQILADRDAIQQVLINLVGNAIKFTPTNGKVSISAFQNNSSIIIKVKDTGLGIPKNDLLKIFGKFYRVDRPGIEIQGTGLGLSLVKEIVDFHKGKIEVQSEVNKGTEFTIILPIKNEQKNGK